VNKKTFRESLPNDVEELKDIIELQLADLKQLRKQQQYLNPKYISVSFNKNKPKPFEF